MSGSAIILTALFLAIILIANVNRSNQDKKYSRPSQAPYSNRNTNSLTPREWSKNILKSNSALILDSETTGLGENDEMVQLAIIDLDGNTLFNSLIKPSKSKRISPKAQAVHGITREMLKDAPTFGDIAKDVFHIINGKEIVTYNAEFDRRMLLQTMSKYPEADAGNISRLTATFSCAMKAYSAYVGEYWEWKNDYKWQKLPNGDHSALGDCLATLKVIKKMAA